MDMKSFLFLSKLTSITSLKLRLYDPVYSTCIHSVAFALTSLNITIPSHHMDQTMSFHQFSSLEKLTELTFWEKGWDESLSYIRWCDSFSSHPHLPFILCFGNFEIRNSEVIGHEPLPYPETIPMLLLLKTIPTKPAAPPRIYISDGASNDSIVTFDFLQTLGILHLPFVVGLDAFSHDDKPHPLISSDVVRIPYKNGIYNQINSTPDMERALLLF